MTGIVSSGNTAILNIDHCNRVRTQLSRDLFRICQETRSKRADSGNVSSARRLVNDKRGLSRVLPGRDPSCLLPAWH